MNRFKSSMMLLVAMIFSSVLICFADELQGTVEVERNNARQITGAILHVGNQEYSIVMDDNGRSIAQSYEHKEIRIECTLNGNQLKAITWKGIKPPQGPAYVEPEPEPEPEEEVEETEQTEQTEEEVEETEQDKNADEENGENDDEDTDKQNEDQDNESSEEQEE